MNKKKDWQLEAAKNLHEAIWGKNYDPYKRGALSTHSKY